MEDSDTQESILELSRNAYRAMEAARIAVQKGGTKEDAEAAAYEILSESFSCCDVSVPSATMLSSGDSFQSSVTGATEPNWVVAKSQAVMFAAMALAPAAKSGMLTGDIPPSGSSRTLENDPQQEAIEVVVQAAHDESNSVPKAPIIQPDSSSSHHHGDETPPPSRPSSVRRPGGSKGSSAAMSENDVGGPISPISVASFIAGTSRKSRHVTDDDHENDTVSQVSSVRSLRQEPGGSVGKDLYLKGYQGSSTRSSSSFPQVIETSSHTYRGDDVSSLPSVRREPSGELANMLLAKNKKKNDEAREEVFPIVRPGVDASVELKKKDPRGSKKHLLHGSGSSTKSKTNSKTDQEDKPKKKKKKRSSSKSVSSGRSVSREPRGSRSPRSRNKTPRAARLRIQSGEKVWLARGYKAVEPPPTARSYFASLAARYSELAPRTRAVDDYAGDGFLTQEPEQRVLSVCIPCFNEEASSLYRTIHSLRRSYLPPGVVLEILVVIDGKQQISASMAKYLRSLFGISVTEDDPRKNPFVTFPNAQTIVVENVSNGDARDPLTLLIKRTNKRKVNSQKWWLYGHARDTCAEFAFATDCGIVFDRKCLLLLIERMIRQPNCHALTGYQRVMPAQMQGDGTFEICADPMGFFLRQLQSYDFEMSQSTTKSLVDSLGFIPVLPGPCSLFRYKAFLGVSREYFQLTTMPLRGDSSDVVLGNVQLAEDRFPPVLLTFGYSDEALDDGEKNDSPEGSKKLLPVTGFEHDAIFYFEAEKPLGQLVRQRRRWINGAYMAAYWALKGGWIGKSKQGFIVRWGASSVLLFEILQGLMIRLAVPATLSCGLFFMVRIIPAIYLEDAASVTEIMDGNVGDPLSSLYGIVAASLYMGGFAVFMVAHTPRAVPSEGKPGEEVTYHIDTRTAYRPRLFAMSYLLNFLLTVMFLYVGYGVYHLVGWSGAPIYFRMLTVLIAFPYVVALLDGIINSNKPSFKAFINLILLTPVFLSASLWFYVWFPCYASARISDLSWGNRAAHQDSSTSIIARHRAYLGRVVSVSIVVINVVLSICIIGIMNVVEKFLSIILFTLLGFNILLHVANLFDMFFRFLRHTLPHWLYGTPPPPLKFRAANVLDEDEEDLIGRMYEDEESVDGSEDFEVFYEVCEDPRGGEERSSVSSLSKQTYSVSSMSKQTH